MYVLALLHYAIVVIVHVLTENGIIYYTHKSRIKVLLLKEKPKVLAPKPPLTATWSDGANLSCEK